MDEIQLSRFDQGMMDLLTMDSCAITPMGYRSFIQAKSMHNSLNWTAIGEQRYYNDNQLHWLA